MGKKSLVNNYVQGGIIWISAMRFFWNAVRVYLYRKSVRNCLVMLFGVSLGVAIRYFSLGFATIISCRWRVLLTFVIRN